MFVMMMFVMIMMMNGRCFGYNNYGAGLPKF